MTVVDLRPPTETPLSNVQAEQGLIGALLYEPRLLEDLAHVRTEMFYEPTHAAIWDSVCQMVRAGCIPDPIVIAERLDSHAGLKEFGGLGFLANLVDAANPRTARTHADMVVNAARLRGLVTFADEVRASARTGVDAFDLLAGAERELSRMVQDAAPAALNLVDGRTSAFATMDEIDAEAVAGRAKGYMTGLRCFDRRMRGLRPGWLVVVAGRPSMGKTALARAAALGCARKTTAQVVFFALEMARRELDERTLSQLSHEAGEGIAYKDMNGDSLTPTDRKWLRDMAGHVPTNFIIDDSPVLSVDYVRRRVLALKRKGPLAAVFIDYLQIMDRPTAQGRNEASVIGEMTKGLKQLAREAETCVVLLSQINRAVENRDDKRPQLSDLRESGAIEQDANAVLFPFRPVYYEERAEPTDATKRQAWEIRCGELHRRMDVIAAKVRQGAVGTDKQLYFAEYDFIEDAPEEGRA